MDSNSRLARISQHGQQIWLDKLSRSLVSSGELSRWVHEHGVAGVTSNPAIFATAIASDPAYAAPLAALKTTEPDAEQRFEKLALPDIKAACQVLRPLYESSGGQAGYVSFEVSPRLARDGSGTLAAARRLWQAIGEPNAMIKIPATPECTEAIADATAEGINVNVTLIFNASQARRVFDAFEEGLRRRLAAGLPLAAVRGVASVFISRVDTAADKLLPEALAELRGQLGIASARRTYALWKEQFEGKRFAELAANGARAPWCLWASTGTKNPQERDTRYVEALIGPFTVNTAPDATLAAFLDHGEVSRQLDADLEGAQAMIETALLNGLDLEALGEQLQRDGLALFDQAFDKLLTLVS
jgi:transaldolase